MTIKTTRPADTTVVRIKPAVALTKKLTKLAKSLQGIKRIESAEDYQSFTKICARPRRSNGPSNSTTRRSRNPSITHTQG